MPYFSKNLCLFSEVTGVVLNHGKPVANAEVERIHDWKRPKSEIVKNDEEGRFSFPAIRAKNIKLGGSQNTITNRTENFTEKQLTFSAILNQNRTTEKKNFSVLLGLLLSLLNDSRFTSHLKETPNDVAYSDTSPKYG